MIGAGHPSRAAARPGDHADHGVDHGLPCFECLPAAAPGSARPARRGSPRHGMAQGPRVPFQAAIIGAGMPGILAGFRLKQAWRAVRNPGQNHDVGGPWLEDGCPVESHGTRCCVRWGVRGWSSASPGRVRAGRCHHGRQVRTRRPRGWARPRCRGRHRRWRAVRARVPVPGPARGPHRPRGPGAGAAGGGHRARPCRGPYGAT